jgi:acetyl-CoA acyltransferase 1
VPVRTSIKDDKTETSKDVVIDTDEGVRANTTAEGLAKLPSAFKMCVYSLLFVSRGD